MPETIRTYSTVRATDSQLREAYMTTFIKYAVRGIAIQSPETVPLFGGTRKVSKGRKLGAKNKTKHTEKQNETLMRKAE